MLRRMYLVSSYYVAGRKQSRTPPSPTTQMPTTTRQESRTKRFKKKKTTNHGRRRRLTEEQHPYEKWVKLRSETQEADIDRKTLIQKIADFLEKVFPNSNAHPEQTVVAPPPLSPPVSPDFKSEAPASPSGTPFLSREHESLFASLLNARCPRTRTTRGLPVMSQVNRR